MPRLTNSTCKECDTLLYENNTSGLCKKHYRRKWYVEHKEQEVNRSRLQSIKLRTENRAEFNRRERGYQQIWRQKVLDYYGNKCSCCGETEKYFLAVDHINGCSNKERNKAKGTHFYRLVLRNPHLYRLLCHNCNHGRFLNGGICPHKNKTEEGNNG